MRQTSIWSYIWIGTCLRFLQDQREGFPIHEASSTLFNIERFLSRLDDLGLHVTRRASSELIEMQELLKDKPKDHKLTNEEATRLSRIATEIRQTFEAETRGVFIYAVMDKRLDVRKLLGAVNELFAPDVYDALPEVARFDYAEAGKCIAFERPTAAAFHILRATEDVLRLYYKRLIRPAQASLTWGQITTALRQKARGKMPDPIILNQLDHIRNAFRNPTQHPDKIYDIQEVQDMLGLCIDVVNRMSVVMKK
jgi:hypothetical protein